MPRYNSGKQLKRLNGRRAWYIVEYVAGERRARSTGTEERAVAEEILDAERDRDRREREAERRRRDGASDPAGYTIAEALDFYLTNKGPHLAAKDRAAFATVRLLEHFGGEAVDTLNAVRCGRYVAERGASDATVRRELGVLTAALNYAVDNGQLTRAPKVHRPAAPEGRDRWLRRGEAVRLLNAARNSRSDSRLYLPLFILLALYTGARKEAILSLRWSQVDLEARTINFREPGKKRTAKGRAIVPITARLMTFLRLARRRGTDLGYVVHRDGERLGDIKKGFARVCRDAGLEGVTPHTLRHTCATWQAQAGVPLFEVARWLGQSVSRTTELYAHHSPDLMHGGVRALDRRRG